MQQAPLKQSQIPFICNCLKQYIIHWIGFHWKSFLIQGCESFSFQLIIVSSLSKFPCAKISAFFSEKYFVFLLQFHMVSSFLTNFVKCPHTPQACFIPISYEGLRFTRKEQICIYKRKTCNVSEVNKVLFPYQIDFGVN